MIFNRHQYPIRIIARPKLSGVGEHWGVQLPNGDVAHLSPAGEEVVNLQTFAQGRKVREVRRASPEQHAQIQRRLAASLQNPGPYRVVDRNCETYATWLVGEKPQSPQILAVIVFGLIAAYLRFA